MRLRLPVGLALLAFSGAAPAPLVTTVPHTFDAGTAAVASEVNDNFQALATAVDSGIPGYEIVQATGTVPANATSGANFTVDCPSGKSVLSGGYDIGGYAVAQQNKPVSSSRWQVQVNNQQSVTLPITVYAICATAR